MTQNEMAMTITLKALDLGHISLMQSDSILCDDKEEKLAEKINSFNAEQINNFFSSVNKHLEKFNTKSGSY